MKKTVIFDVDGTLVDSVALHAACWQEAFARHGKKISRRTLQLQIGKGGDKILPVFLSAAEIRRFGDELKEEREDIFQTQYLRRVKPFPKVQALMKRLKADGFSIVLGSSGKKLEIRHYIELLKIGTIIDSFTTSEDATKSKPEPDIFQAALHKIGHSAAGEVLVIGDSPYDAEAAQRAHLQSIGLLSGGFPRAMLLKAGCFQVFRDPADLLARYRYSPWPWQA